MGATEQIKTTAINKGSPAFNFVLWFKQGQPTGYGGRYPNSIQNILFRHTTGGTENNNYSFSAGKGHPLTFKTGTKFLQFAQVTGTFANGHGSLNLTFKATGPVSNVSVPKGCTGHGGKKRTGTLSGSYTLHTGDHLGTITQKSFKATISTASFQCNKAAHGYELQTTGFKPAWVDVFKNKTGSVLEQFLVSSAGSGWVIDHTFTVSGLPPSDYTLNTSKLNSAHVIGGGGISGSASYSSQKSSSSQTVGTMSGTLAAPFVSIGKKAGFPNGSHRSAKQSHS